VNVVGTWERGRKNRRRLAHGRERENGRESKREQRKRKKEVRENRVGYIAGKRLKGERSRIEKVEVRDSILENW